MKTNAAPDAVPPASTLGGWANAWVGFWFRPAAPLGLHWVRFLAGLLFLSWLLPLTGERAALFGLNGWFDAQAYREASRLRELPVPIGWSLNYAAGTNAAALDVIWWGSLAVLALFTLGVATRVTAVLTWIVVVSFLASPATHADTDNMLAILAFYLMIGYVFLGQWNRPLSLLERVLGPRGTSVFAVLRRTDDEAAPSYAANLALRLLQVHFAIVVVTSGLHKLQFGDWWAGVAYWYPLNPPLQMDLARLEAARATAGATLFFLSVAGYAALAWQLAFPLFAFRARCRPLLLAGAAIAWLGSALLYGDPTFGPFYALACLSFLGAGEWRWLTDRLRAPLDRRAEQAAAPPAARKRELGVAQRES